MTGLEKLLAKLDEENRAACEAVLAEARREADRLKAQARQTAGQQADEIVAKARKAAADQERLARSAAAMRQRQKSLEARVGAVDEAVRRARAQLESLGGDAFYDAVARLAAAGAMAGAGTLYMTGDDVRDMPADFADRLNAAVGPGKRLTVAARALPSRGAVIDYGDIEVDLRFSELIAADEDALRTLAQRILFP